MQLIECVPNFSEGQRPEVMDAIQQAVESVAGIALLDRHVDASHNRMVLTFAGTPGPIAEAAFRVVARAAELIDLTTHRGVHPRIGATDVLPFVPIGSTSMQLAIELANRVGRRIAAELALPIFLYAEAATRPERRRLPDIRQGEFEYFREHIADDPRLEPDFGPRVIGPAGATAVGARPPLVAYNITLASSDIRVARAIARTIRESSGGMPAVQARGFLTADPDVVQVSMNLLDIRRTPLHTVFERVRLEAEQRGVSVLESELVGLLPADALVQLGREYLRFAKLDSAAVLETRLLEAALSAAES